MKAFRKMMFADRGQEPFRAEHREPAETFRRRYPHLDAALEPKSPGAQTISTHPVVRILRRIDDLRREDQAGYGVKQQAERTRAELEACLAAIQRGTN